MKLVPHSPRQLAAPLCVLTLAILAACGGGGGGGAGESDASGVAPRTDQTAQISPASGGGGKLLLSEVASNYYNDDVAWFELYNGTGASINLADYTLVSSWMDSATGRSSLAPMPFPLPAVTMAPGAHLVVGARTHDKLRDTAQMIYVSSEGKRPYWNGNGSLELQQAGATVDFVRFGASSAAPASEDGWRGAAVGKLTSGANEHGKSIVRLAADGMTDTDTAADWKQVNFATPGGRNDVAPGVNDSDGDGIPDSAKLPGGTYGGLDLYAMGARPGRRDAFMEIDYMQGNDAALTPRREALQMVVDAFARHNIALHIDTGTLHGTDTASFNLGGGSAVPYAKCIELDLANAPLRAGCTSFYDYKRAHFDLRRKLVFHYALFANSQRLDGGAGSSGVAELNGADLIVTLGGYGFRGTEGVDRNMLINLQASTLMHEFGHNLGLRHGGNEDVNYKPNHYSVMNYMYQFAGLSAQPHSPYAAERYYLANGLKGKSYCNLTENSPCSSNFVIDFSNGSGAALNEQSLSEAVNIGRGSSEGAYADWDNNGTYTADPVARNINPIYGSSKTVLKDFDEWGSLAFSFSRNYSGTQLGAGLFWDWPYFGAPAAATDPGHESEADAEVERRANPMNQAARSRTVEEPLPQDLHETLLRSRFWR